MRCELKVNIYIVNTLNLAAILTVLTTSLQTLDLSNIYVSQHFVMKKKIFLVQLFNKNILSENLYPTICPCINALTLYSINLALTAEQDIRRHS